MDHNPAPSRKTRDIDPFTEEFFGEPYVEEIRANARLMLDHNRDALRHHIGELAWATVGDGKADYIRTYIVVYWHWEDIEPEWIAEARFMNIRDVCAVAESIQLWHFYCLDCKGEIEAKHRRHLLQMQASLEAFCSGDDGEHLANLLCKGCIVKRKEADEEQRQFAYERQQALIEENRKRPYSERRQGKEWEVTKRMIHRRDGYRCRICNRGDLQLHTHHRTYSTFDEERLEDLITLCSECHALFHRWSKVS